MAGPFYFAWVDSDEAFDPATHAREDEEIFEFTVSQVENEFASLSLTVRNPRVGLLSAGRKVWAWLAWDSGAGVEPLFFGRLVGVPTDVNAELVTLEFTARPADFVDRKAAKAESLKVRPYYDPIWIDPDSLDDPGTVLEARSAYWSIDRVTHEVDISDVLQGEDGEATFAAPDVPYDSVHINLAETPLRSVSVDASVNWTQSSQGSFDFAINVLTYTGQSLISDWPAVDTSYDGGWTVTASQARDRYGVDNVENISYSTNWQNHEKTHATGDSMSLSISSSVPNLRGPALTAQMTGRMQTGVVAEGGPSSDPVNIPNQVESTTMYVPLWNVEASMTLQYAASRDRKEHLRFTLSADVQAIVTLADETDVLALTLDSQDVSAEVAGDDPPIGDPGRRSYLPTDRGLWSLEYLVALARANLLIKARAVEVEFDIPFARAVHLSCRKNARLMDDRLPGGTALGKVISYSFGMDGTTGLASGSVTIGCAIGYDGEIAEAPGEPTYAAPGYVGPGYQAYSGAVAVLPLSDVGYTIPIDAPADDGLIFPLTKSAAVVQEAISGYYQEQEAVIEAAFPYDQFIAQAEATSAEQQAKIAQATALSVTEALKSSPVSYTLELRPVAGMSFETEFDIEVSELKVPKMIDLEAPSSP